MSYLKSIVASIGLKAALFSLFSLLMISAEAQNTSLVINGETILKSRSKGLGLNVGVKKVSYKDEPLEGVSIVVKKNGKTVHTAKSGKKGKFSFEIPVSITDSKNDYVVYLTKDGAGPRMVDINAFIPSKESDKYAAPKHECELSVSFFETTVKGIPMDKAFALIKWDKIREHKFTIDQMYGRRVLADERKLMADPDVYYTALIKKVKRKEAILAKKKAAADAKKKAAELAKQKEEAEIARLAEKMKEELRKEIKEDATKGPDVIKQEKAQALKSEKIKERIPAGTQTAQGSKATATVDIKSNIKKALHAGKESKDYYDASLAYSINIARNVMKLQKEKRNREKGKNLSSKYESTNILTSLLDVVVEYEKGRKKQ